MVKVVIIFNWLLAVLFLIAIIMVFDPLGHHYEAHSASGGNRLSARTLDHIFEKRTRIWEWRVKLLCCSCVSCKLTPSSRVQTVKCHF